MNENIKKIIGNRINEALALRDVKQKELAQEINVADNTISYFVSGKRTPNTAQIIQIANFLEVSTDYILGQSDNAEIDNKAIGKRLGLNDDAIETLEYIMSSDEIRKDNPSFYLNQILQDETTIIKFIRSIRQYIYNKTLREYIKNKLKENRNIIEANFDSLKNDLKQFKNQIDANMVFDCHIQRVLDCLQISDDDGYREYMAIKSILKLLDLDTQTVLENEPKILEYDDILNLKSYDEIFDWKFKRMENSLFD